MADKLEIKWAKAPPFLALCSLILFSTIAITRSVVVNVNVFISFWLAGAHCFTEAMTFALLALSLQKQSRGQQGALSLGSGVYMTSISLGVLIGPLLTGLLSEYGFQNRIHHALLAVSAGFLAPAVLLFAIMFHNFDSQDRLEIELDSYLQSDDSTKL